MKGERDLQLLVCTANLGNAPPDNDSIACWIPSDGRCVDVLPEEFSNVVLNKPLTDGISTLEEVDEENDDSVECIGKSNDLEMRNKSKPHGSNVSSLSISKSSTKTTKSIRTQMKYPLRRRDDLPASYNSCDRSVATGSVYNSTNSMMTNVGSSKSLQRQSQLDDGLVTEDNDALLNPTVYYTDEEQYDIIVIGMQEATFNTPGKEESKISQNVCTMDLSDNPSSHRRNFTAPIQKGAEAVTGAVSGVVKMPIKQLQAMQGLAGVSRDHTKKMPRNSSRPDDDQDDSLRVVEGQSHQDGTPYTVSERRVAPYDLPNNSNSNSNILKTTFSTLKYVSTDILAPEWLDGTPFLHCTLDARLPSYKRIVSYQRGEMRLEVYVHTSQVDVQVLHVDAQNTGRAGLANKGGIAAELLINGNTILSFITAHLEAHEGHSKYLMRCKTIGDILEGTKVPKKGYPDLSSTAHVAFVLGDLNFRSELDGASHLSDEEHIEQVRELVNAKNWDELNNIDELSKAIKSKDCLVGFQTLFCNFPPTFKVLRQKGYAYKENRRPSYTDRVLWKAGHLLEERVKPILYEAIDNFSTSDHKPVRCAFSVELNESFRLRPRLTRPSPSLHLSQKSNRQRTIIRTLIPFLKGSDNIKSALGHVAQKERLILFLTELQCSINRGSGQAATNLPDPFVCLLSTPAALLWSSSVKSDRKSLKSIVVRRMRRLLPLKAYTSTRGWPQTSVMKETFDPDWGDEELHVEICTHHPDGSPVELGGAMLHLSVMDSQSDGGDAVLLGTFSFNLSFLIRSSTQSKKESSTGILQPNQKKTIAPERGDLKRAKTVFNLFSPTPHGDDGKNTSGVSHDKHHPDPSCSSDHEPVASFECNESLLRNGVETGRIRCRIECWWMDEATAKASTLFGGVLGPYHLRHSLHKEGPGRNRMKGQGELQSEKMKASTYSSFRKQKENPKQDQEETGALNGTVFGKTEDGHGIMLKQRKAPPTQSQCG